MQATLSSKSEIDEQTKAFYSETLKVLNASGIPFLVGGAYALAQYTGIERHTKDLDVFVRREDCLRTLAVLRRAGYRTEMTFPHWLGKAFHGGEFVDVIFSSGNAIAEVDDLWFEHSVDGEILGVAVKLSPVEEMIWSKAFVMERERYDGADVAHILRMCGSALDWRRLLNRFEDNRRVLFAHLTLFGFIYPSERNKVPQWVMKELLTYLSEELDSEPKDEKICRGTLISRAQYLVDVDRDGFRDARLEPAGKMTAEEIEHWTAAIDTVK
jgi:hypothetical protein